MTEKKPLILITNDDGYLSKGILSLIDSVRDLGDIIVFAPDSARSGMSSAISSLTPLRATVHKKEDNVTTYICNGTPADCVKLALHHFIDRKPDLLLAGINHGSNSAISVVYSGTLGAAIEGCIAKIPSVGMSLCDHSPNAEFSESKRITRLVVEKVLKEGLPQGVCLNVNVPVGDVKGVKICSQTQGKWVNEYKKSEDGIGKDVFWMTGNFENWEPENENTDEWALADGYAAVVPVKIDMTAYDFIPELEKWNL